MTRTMARHKKTEKTQRRTTQRTASRLAVASKKIKAPPDRGHTTKHTQKTERTEENTHNTSILRYTTETIVANNKSYRKPSVIAPMDATELPILGRIAFAN